MVADRRILVTGGAGFIGSQVARDLHEADADVLVVDNCFAGVESLVPEGVRFEDVDIRAPRLSSVVHDFDPDVVVHLAAIHYIPYCNEHPEEAFEVNVVGTRNLLAVTREMPGLERVVFGSSAAVYPPRNEPHAESSETGPMDVYGQTKLVGEDLMELFHRETGVPTAAARLFNVYGPNETNEHLIPAVLKQVKAGDRRIELGNLSPKRDFVHVTDVSEALTTLAGEFDGSFRTYNVGTGAEHSVREVVAYTSEALGEEVEIVQDEGRVRESDRPHLCADVSRIRAEFDWEPEVEFVAGLRELLKDDQVLVG